MSRACSATHSGLIAGVSPRTWSRTNRQNGWPTGSKSTRTSPCGWNSAGVAPSATAWATPASRSVTSKSRCSIISWSPCEVREAGQTGGTYGFDVWKPRPDPPPGGRSFTQSGSSCTVSQPSRRR
ncbi:hypothetical protein SMICM17S_10062 [Streptomyces microflavus]